MNKQLNSRNLLTIIFSVGLFVALGFLLGSTVLLKFKSEGVLNIDMSVAEHKRFSEASGSAATLKQVLVAIPPLVAEDAAIIERLILASSDKWQIPVPRITKLDSKDLPDALLKIELDSDKELDKNLRVYVGARLTATSPDAEQAARITLWLGSYYKEVATREAMREQLFVWLAENRRFATKAQETKIKLSFDIEQARTRAAALRKVLAQYPDLAKFDGRQVVDVRKDNEKFISPGAQLVGTETEIIDITEKIARIDRSLLQHNFAQNYFLEAEKTLATVNTGSGLIIAFSNLTKKYTEKANNDAEREKLLSIAAVVAQISSRFLLQAQFVLPPAVPLRAEAPRPLMLGALFGLLGLFLSVAWVFRDWLKEQLVAGFTQTANA